MSPAWDLTQPPCAEQGGGRLKRPMLKALIVLLLNQTRQLLSDFACFLLVFSNNKSGDRGTWWSLGAQRRQQMIQLTLKTMVMEASRIKPKFFSSPQLSFPTDTHRPSLHKPGLTPPDIASPQTQQFQPPPFASPLMFMRAKVVSLAHLCLHRWMDVQALSPEPSHLLHNYWVKPVRSVPAGGQEEMLGVGLLPCPLLAS